MSYKTYTKTISKSQFMRGIQCQKSLWLYFFQKNLATPPSQATQNLFKQGHDVGKLAQELYPGGKLVPYIEGKFSEKFRQTAQYIQTEHTIYEAAFQHNNTMCMIDILHNPGTGWELIEVKSSTSEKEETLTDIAIQYYIASLSGIIITKAKLIHLNNTYTRGKTLELSELFTEVDVTEKILAKQDEVKQHHDTFTALSQSGMPEIPVGKQCTTPHDCDFMAHCWKNIGEDHILSYKGMPYDDKFRWAAEGKTQLTDVVNEVAEPMAIVINTELTKTPHIDKASLSAFLKTIYFPLYILDFESFQSPIPPFENTRPYQQIPFQFSMHCKNSPFDVLAHEAFIDLTGKDPREKMIKALIKIPKNTCILVYNAMFEQGIIKDLAEAFPKYAEDLLRLNDQMIDVMIPFKEKWVYYPGMMGSYSLKKALPALVKDVSYDDLDVQSGELTSVKYREAASAPEKRPQIEKELLEYCNMDTLALMRLYEELCLLG